MLNNESTICTETPMDASQFKDDFDPIFHSFTISKDKEKEKSREERDLAKRRLELIE
jgi:hypothetical protein